MNKGFTVVEIVVVLGIMIIITGIVLFNAGSEKQTSALFRSAQKLSLDLRKAENYALSSKVFKDRVPCGWGIHFNGAGSMNYIIFADTATPQNCSDRNYKRDDNGGEDLEVVNLEAGVKINNILPIGISDITFTPPAPIVRFEHMYGDQVATDKVDITLINNKSSTRTITINKAGFISSP